MARRSATYKLHPDEEIIDALEEKFHADLELMVKFVTTNGRPIFNVPLTDEEKWQRFANPTTRAKILEKILATEGPKAVKEYVMSMYKIAKKILTDDPDGYGPRSVMDAGQ